MSDIPKRASNAKRKARMDASYARGVRRKDARRKAQAEREATNRAAVPREYFRMRDVNLANGGITMRKETPSQARRRYERERLARHNRNAMLAVAGKLD